MVYPSDATFPGSDVFPDTPVPYLTVTPYPLARPPYVEITYHSGSVDSQAVGVTILRDGEVVRVPSAVTASGQITTWRDYDAPFDLLSTYTVAVQVRTAPTITVTETWTGTLSSRWSPTTLTPVTNQMMRTNLCPTPSFEGGSVGAWAAYSGNSAIVTSPTQARLGTRSLRITPTPTVITNLVTDPTFQNNAADSGWTPGAGAATMSGTGGRAVMVGDITTSGRGYLNSPIYAVTAGVRYYFGINVTRSNGGGYDGVTGLLFRWFNSSNVQVGSDQVLSQNLPDGGLYAVAYNAVAPAGATRLRIYPFTEKVNNGHATYLGDAIVDNVYVNNGNAGLFTGSTPDTAAVTYAWTGTPFLSTSTATYAVATIGAKIALTGLTPGSAYTFAPYVYGVLGGTGTVRLRVEHGAAVTTYNAGAENATWARPSVTFTPAAGVTTATCYVLLDGVGFSVDPRYVDCILIENTDVARPYFDGSNSTLIPASSLGTWAVAWTGSTEASTSIARYSAAVTSGSGTRTLAGGYASSGINFEGFRITAATGASIPFTLAFADGSTLVYTVSRTAAGIRQQIRQGTSVAYFDRSGNFTGLTSLSFLNGRAYLSSVETGATISVPVTSTTVNTVQVALDSGEIMLPFAFVPLVTNTTDTLTGTATLSPTGAWLIHPYFPERSIEIDAGQGCSTDLFVTADSARTLTRASVTALLAPVGARRQIAVSFGPRKAPEWEIALSTKTGAAYDALVALLDDAAPLRFDYPDALGAGEGSFGEGSFGEGSFGEGSFGEGGFGFGEDPTDCEPLLMRIPKGWFSPGNVTETRPGNDWRDPLRGWTIPFSPIVQPTAVPAGA